MHKKIRFIREWRKVYGMDAPVRFLFTQFELMEKGIRDVRIHDNTFYVWGLIGGKNV